MEKDSAIMFADLSGYSALTEAHGADTAADTIEKYLEIVANSLVGSSRLQERTGDEVMIIADLPDHLLSTALIILNNISRENNFLLVHGGLHYGRILKRNNAYFGTAINITARIAAKAGAGCFWCSKEFTDAIENKTAYHFESRGVDTFKNIAAEIEVFELVNDKPGFLAIDPVCRMLIQSEDKALRHPVDKDVFFCSTNCLNKYVSAKKE
jgi:class 3 adenylate cyclase/YHS domain-containing protein